MGILVREALLRLCAEIGWTYAVFWRAVGTRSLTHLVWEDGHCEPSLGISGFEAMDLRLKEKGIARYSGSNRNAEMGGEVEDKIGMLLRKMMITQVHVIGDGVLGQAALTGNHRWIIHDDALDCFPTKGLSEMNFQFSAGVKTIAIIPVLPHGVLQLGSTDMVIENVGFINHVKCLFAELGCTSGAFLSDLPNKTSSIRSSIIQYPLVRTPSGQLGNTYAMSAGTVSNVSDQSAQQIHGNQILGSSQLSCSSFLASNSDILPGTSVLPSAKLDFPPTLQSLVNSVHPYGSLGCRSSGAQIDFRGATFDNKSQFSVSSLMQGEMLPPMSSFDSLGNNPNLSCSQSLQLMQDLWFSGNFRSLDPSLFDKRSNAPGVVCSMPSISSSYANSCSISLQNKLKEKTQGNVLSRITDASIASVGESSSCYDMVLDSLPGCRIDVSGANKESSSGLNFDCKVSKNMNHSDGKEEKSSSVLAAFPGENYIRDNNACVSEVGPDIFTSIIDTGGDPFFDVLNSGDSYDDIFAEDNHDQLLDAIISKVRSSVKQNPDDYSSCKTSVTKTSFHSLRSSPCGSNGMLDSKPLGSLPALIKKEALISDSVKPSVSGDRNDGCSLTYKGCKPQMFPWVATDQSMKRDTSSAVHGKQGEETAKMNRKRARPGESPRPRPKDRQMIQDRVKELREIVPNGAKCSIDALLERTIKHMLFLQSVTKYADKLKDTTEPKIISKEGGLVLKDNFEGGATWAFEVGSQSVICPIIVEDLNPPRQLLVEMLCEEHGYFLEIADLIKGLGLTILKGVMEARDSKIWSQFAVEANRDVTRMEIFLSLVRLLEPTMGKSYSAPSRMENPSVKAPSCSIPATGATERLV